MIWVLWPIFTFWWWLDAKLRPTPEHYCRRRHSTTENVDEISEPSSSRAKPEWVPDAVVRTAAHRPISFRTYRKVAASFNRRYRDAGVSVGKDYVGDIIKEHATIVAALHRQWRARPPRHTPVDHTWAMDITGLGDDQTLALGILDHGSRALLNAVPLRRKTACAIARHLIDVIEAFGAPACLRTDNEGMFTSAAMRFVHAWFGIRHQRIQPRHPWQNGRIERFFGTLKQEINAVIDTSLPLSLQLTLFLRYYNEFRPHQALQGRTPDQARRSHAEGTGRNDSG
jgi:putative transposase